MRIEHSCSLRNILNHILSAGKLIIATKIKHFLHILNIEYFFFYHKVLAKYTLSLQLIFRTPILNQIHSPSHHK